MHETGNKLLKTITHRRESKIIIKPQQNDNNDSIEDDDYDIHLKSRVEYLANGPTVAFAGIKDAMRKSLTNTLDEQLELEAKLQKKCGNTRDFQEGFLAFH